MQLLVATAKGMMTAVVLVTERGDEVTENAHATLIYSRCDQAYDSEGLVSI